MENQGDLRSFINKNDLAFSFILYNDRLKSLFKQEEQTLSNRGM